MARATLNEPENARLLGEASDSGSATPKHSVITNLKMLCEFRIVKKRGAVLVLVWNFFIATTYFFLTSNNGQILDHKIKIPLDRNKQYIGLILIRMGVFYPLAGWLADVHFGRYKTLRYSGWIMCIGIMLTTILVIITKFHESTEKVISQVITLSYFVIVVGLSGYQANIIQFGVDQLTDASSEEIRAFLLWFIWTFISSGSCYKLLMQCIVERNSILFKMLYTATSLTCAIVVDLFFNNHFTKEPVNVNPIKLVVKVLKYAMKTKQPQRRSAFTYWEDKPPSRIDFGKSKYGGPFTHEQVEDVKTFLRMCLVMSTSSIFIGAIFITIYVQYKMMYYFKDSTINSNNFQHCLERNSVQNLHYFCWVIIIPLHEFIIFQKRLQYNIPILTRFLLGMILILITVSIQMTLDVVGHTVTTFNSNVTISVPCLFQAEEKYIAQKGMTIDIRNEWLIAPGLTLGSGMITSTVAAIEFVCAQSPYSMKGMMFGFIYFISGLSTLIAVGIVHPFTEKDIHWTWLGCGLWYYLLVMVIIAATIILWVFVIKWYKNRDRDDELPNTQTFAINYYERYTRHSQRK